MSNQTNSTSGGGIGFTGLLTIVFVALKLCHVITWSWWWVISPIWIAAAVAVTVFAVVFGYMYYADWLKARRRRANMLAEKNRQ